MLRSQQECRVPTRLRQGEQLKRAIKRHPIHFLARKLQWWACTASACLQRCLAPAERSAARRDKRKSSQTTIRGRTCSSITELNRFPVMLVMTDAKVHHFKQKRKPRTKLDEPSTQRRTNVNTRRWRIQRSYRQALVEVRGILVAGAGSDAGGCLPAAPTAGEARLPDLT